MIMQYRYGITGFRSLELAIARCSELYVWGPTIYKVGPKSYLESLLVKYSHFYYMNFCTNNERLADSIFKMH